MERPHAQAFQNLPVLPSVPGSTTSSSNTALTVTITPGAGRRVVLYLAEAYTSAGVCTFSVESPSGTVVYQGAASGIGTTAFVLEPLTPWVFNLGVAVLLKNTAAGVGNTSTINRHYSLI